MHIKLIDKIVYYRFLLHVGLMGLMIIVMINSVINVVPIEDLNLFDDNFIMTYIFPVFVINFMILWIYCMWFYSKFDYKSNNLFYLLFFNWIYAPFYYYDVKIKQRPLMVDPKQKPDKVDTEMEISNSEFDNLTRDSIKNIIDLWASKQKQIDYQSQQHDTNVLIDLFLQWEDFYNPKSDDFKNVFSDKELKYLSDFNDIITDLKPKSFDNLPILTDYMQTDNWININKIATDLIKEFK